MKRVENKYKLKIRSNWYKSEVDIYEGNGTYARYAEGCFSQNNENFLIYPLLSQFYLWVGPGKQLVNVDRVILKVPDINNYEKDPNIFYKYANLLLDRYIEKTFK